MSDIGDRPGAPENPGGLTHLDPEGRVRMVDVGDKSETRRIAVAEGVFRTRPDVVRMVAADSRPGGAAAAPRGGSGDPAGEKTVTTPPLKKADVLATARLAGIGAAKRTSELIPLCHQLALTSVTVEFDLDSGAGTIGVTATAKTTGRTGVEMEALTAVSVAGLTLHDMVKAVDPLATMDGIRLAAKSGGKRGDWTREGGDDPGAATSGTASGASGLGNDDEERARHRAPAGGTPTPPGRVAAVLVSSTAGALGEREDTTGPVIQRWLAERHFSPVLTDVVADADLGPELAQRVADRLAVVITTGGTGVSPDDRTPEVTRPLLDVELPGVAEAMRAKGLAATPTAALSRGLVGFAGPTLVINLPGSEGGVRDGLEVLDGLFEHLLAVHAGTADHGEAGDRDDADRAGGAHGGAPHDGTQNAGTTP